MTKRLAAIGVLLLVGIFSIAGCGGGSQKQNLSIATGTAGGSFYNIGVAIADVVNKEVPNVIAVAEETGGSAENMSLLQNGSVQMSMAPLAIAIPALRGTDPKLPKVDMVAGWYLFDAPLQWVALKESGVKTLYDLKGKKVALGPQGSGGTKQAISVLRVHGITVNDFQPVYMGYGEAIEAMADGLIDASVQLYPVPASTIQQLTKQRDIVLVTADEKALNKLTDMPPVPVIIPPNTYKGQSEPVLIQGAPSYLWVRPDLAEDLVYRVVKAVFTKKPELETGNPLLKEMRLVTKSEAERLGVKVHPGVIRYAEEIGAWSK